MPAANQDADDPAQDWTVARALVLLEQALEIIDAWGDRPAIGESTGPEAKAAA